MKKYFIGLITVLFTFGIAAQASALSISVDGSSTANATMTWTLSGTTITINENWLNGGNLFLNFSDLASGTNYNIVKNITNNTGNDWTSFASELLDPSGDTNDSRDPSPQPAWVPSGFTTSNDFDGLSFAQGSGLTRTSSYFADITVDELTDSRDFIDFYNGTWANGSSGIIKYGLRDSGSNQPFLLSQRPNERSNEVPEPSTMLLLGTGLFALAAYNRKKRDK